MEPPRASNPTRHTCGHCQQEVFTVEGCRPFGSAGKTKWRLPLKHGPGAVRQAALAGCPFFVWLWDQLKGSQTPPEQMIRTTIVLELEATTLKRMTGPDSPEATLSRLTINDSEQETYDITGCVVKVETDSYAWTAGSFIAMSDWDDPSASKAMARMIDGHTASSQAIAQIRRRLQYCCEHHEACKPRPSDIRPTRFISVGESSTGVRVVPSSSFDDTEPYAALSYCWGQDQSLKSTMANKLEMEKNVPVHLLPKTIQDAIHLTRELHIKLLWVDSLCLVQDDEDELAREVAKMQHYYGNSCVTISAATPSCCSVGFLQPGPMPDVSDDEILGPFYFPVDLGAGGSEKPARIKLVTRRSPIEAIDSRAWTLQEGLLSHRLVSFGSRIVRWSCQTESYGPYKNHDLRDAMRDLSSRMGSKPHPDAVWRWDDTKLWCTLVENYMARGLSNEEDRLPAISGIGSFMCESVGGEQSTVPAREDLPVGVSPAPTPGQGPMDAHDGPGAAEPPDPFQPSSLFSSRIPPEDPSGSIQRVKCAINATYAAGLLHIPLELGYSVHYQSWHLMAQLLWVPLREASRRPRCGWGWKKPYVAPSWSWASHDGAVDMTITRVTDGLYKTLIEQDSTAELREIRIEPTNPEAPFGSLRSASLTLECRVPLSRDHKNKHIAFDDVTQYSVTNEDIRDLGYLQIIPDILSLEAKDVSQLRGIPNGLVLEPAGRRGKDPATGNVWRRVGVYYSYRPGDVAFRPTIVDERGESSRTASGWGLKKLWDVVRGEVPSILAGPQSDEDEVITII